MALDEKFVIDDLIVQEVEDIVCMGHRGWDSISPRDIIRASYQVVADHITRSPTGITVPKKQNKDKQKISQLCTAIRDAREIINEYKDKHPKETLECVNKILYRKDLMPKGGTH